MSETMSITRQRKLAFQWPVVAWLTVVWVLIWGELTIANVLGGLAVATVVIFVFPLPPIAYHGRIRPWGLLKLIGRFHRDLLAASVDVASQTLRLGHQPKSAIVEVQLRGHSDLYMTLTAELLCLIPGSVVVESRRSTRTLYLHALDVEDDEAVERVRQVALAQEERVMRALASDKEWENYLKAAERGGAR